MIVQIYAVSYQPTYWPQIYSDKLPPLELDTRLAYQSLQWPSLDAIILGGIQTPIDADPPVMLPVVHDGKPTPPSLWTEGNDKHFWKLYSSLVVGKNLSVTWNNVVYLMISHTEKAVSMKVIILHLRLK